VQESNVPTCLYILIRLNCFMLEPLVLRSATSLPLLAQSIPCSQEIAETDDGRGRMRKSFRIGLKRGNHGDIG
jgi:hypothetical protein